MRVNGGGGNDAKFGEKWRFRKLAVGDKKGEEAEGRERREGGGRQCRHEHQFLPEEHFMIGIQFPTFFDSV